jgi:hypothetical protein
MVDAFAIGEDFEVLGSDNRHVGEVDGLVEGGVKLTRRDSGSGGRHHLIPLDLVDRVVADERKVFLTVDRDEAERRWTALD